MPKIADPGWWTLAVSMALLGCGTSGGGPSAQRPARVFAANACPADVFLGVQKPIAYLGDACAPDLEGCVARCQANDANACYAAALREQDLGAPTDDSEALFLRACGLGIASGCTNRAAGMVAHAADNATPWPCANRTFEAMCRQDDPWACTMWGSSLLRGRGTARDVARAREALAKGCLLGEDDPACVKARELLAQPDATSD